MSRRQSIPSNLFSRQADPLPPLFPEPHEGDIYFNSSTKSLRVYWRVEGTEDEMSWQDLPYAVSDHTHPSVVEHLWNYDSSPSMAFPGDGEIRTDTDAGTPSTQAALAVLDQNGIDARRVFQELVVGDSIFFQEAANSDNWGIYTISSLPIDNGTWFLLPIAPVKQHGAPIQKNRLVLIRFTSGTEGGGGGFGGLSEEEADDKYLNKLTGGVLGGPLTLAGDPTIDMHAATKKYVDSYPSVLVAPDPPPAPAVGDLWVDVDELLPGAHTIVAGQGLTGGGFLSQGITADTVTLHLAADGITLSAAADQVSVIAAPQWLGQGSRITLSGDITGTSPYWNGSTDLSFTNTAIGSKVIVNADISDTAAIEQVKVANLVTDLSSKISQATANTLYIKIMGGGTLISGDITLFQAPSQNMHAATKKYVDDMVLAGIPAGTVILDAGAVISDNVNGELLIKPKAGGWVNFGSTVLTAVAEPDNATAAATKNYVDTRAPKITVGLTAPVGPAVGDVWIDTNATP